MRPFPPITVRSRRPAFTLIEMLVVIAIIGLIAVTGLPAIKGFGKSNTIAATQRQVLDDLNTARQRAIAERTDVYVLFAAPSATQVLLPVNWNVLNTAQRQQVSNVLRGQYNSYALYVSRSVGDQPGRPTSRYLTKWRSLPDGIFIQTNKFMAGQPRFEGVSPFPTNSFPFPGATNNSVALPYLHFNHLGQLVQAQDDGSEVIPLAQGFVDYGDINNPLVATAVQETPPFNSGTNSTMMNRIRIDALTGRARVEHRELR